MHKLERQLLLDYLRQPAETDDCRSIKGQFSFFLFSCFAYRQYAVSKSLILKRRQNNILPPYDQILVNPPLLHLPFSS